MSEPQPQPWGRLERVLAPHATPSDHFELFRGEHRIGRLAAKCDIVLGERFVSRRHCSIAIKDMDRRTNEPIVTLNNNSILDMFVNKDVVKKGREVLLRHGSIINFTEPSAVKKLAFRFHVLREGLTPENRRLRKLLDEKSKLGAPSSQVETKKRQRSEGAESQGSSNESDGKPVAARTRSQPERKRQKRGSTEPEPAFVTQDENTDSSNFGMVLRNKTPSPGSKAAGKRRRRSVPDDDEEAQESLQNLAPRELQLEHETIIQKQQISSLQRELEKAEETIRERELSEKKAQENEKKALEEARMAREESETLRIALAEEKSASKTEKDDLVYKLHGVERNFVILQNKLQTRENDFNREFRQMENQMKKKDSRIKVLESRLNTQQASTQDMLASSVTSAARTQERSIEAITLIEHIIQQWKNSQAGMSSQEGSEESPSLIANRRVSQESNADNEHSPETPMRNFSDGPALPVDVPRHVMAQLGDESKLGSSQELSQSQSQSQLTPSQDVPVQPMSVMPSASRSRSTRRVLTTSPDEEAKRQQ